MTKMDLKQTLAKMPRIDGLNLSVEGPTTRAHSAGLQLVVNYKGRKLRYNVNCRNDLSTTAVALLASRLASPQERSRHLLYAPFVNTTCGERLRQHGISFIDSCGHVFLQTPDLYLFVVGRVQKIPKRECVLSGTTVPRAFKTATLKMIYAFLADPNLDKAPELALINRNYREIANGTGLALGSVSNALEDLIAAGYVIEQTPGSRILANRRKLFERWVQDYGTRLRPKLVTSRFRAPNPRWWNDATPQTWGGCWGGEVAGAKLTSFLTPETATIYGQEIPNSFVLKHDLHKDPAGGVEFLRPFWQTGKQTIASECVHPIVVYADLAASDIDRCLQTAQRIYERYIRSLVEST